MEKLTFENLSKSEIEEIEKKIFAHKRTIIFLSLEIEELQRNKAKLLGLETNLANKTIEVLELSIRTANCLQNANLTHLTDLVLFCEKNGTSGLLKLKNFGRRSLNEVKDKFREHGLPCSKF